MGISLIPFFYPGQGLQYFGEKFSHSLYILEGELIKLGPIQHLPKLSGNSGPISI